MKTAEDLIPLRNSFRNENDELLPEPSDEDAFPICAGDWPNPHIGARQVRCTCCKGFAGVSPRGWELHLVNPHSRPIFCTTCFIAILGEMRKMGAIP